MIIYIDSEYKCYTSEADGRRAVETNFFDGKCPEWIESFRFVPAGETWMRSDGDVFKGEMVTPWKDLRDEYTAQTAYLERQNAHSESALTEIEAALGVTS